MPNYLLYSSPVGELTLVADDHHLLAIAWPNETPSKILCHPENHHPTHPILLETQRQLEMYFTGQLQYFNLPLRAEGTDFQQRVWQALRQIPFGETRSYLDIATAIGQPAAVRAVGAANGRNPLSIVVPCHRVIGKNGKLTGFAGGLTVKQQLLLIEKKYK